MIEAINGRPKRANTGHVAQIRDALTKVLPTEEAAQALGRQAQTLRRWSSEGNGPIQPVRIRGRLHWRVADIERLLNEGA
jgi:hypothetical protein